MSAILASLLFTQKSGNMYVMECWCGGQIYVAGNIKYILSATAIGHLSQKQIEEHFDFGYKGDFRCWSWQREVAKFWLPSD